MSEQFTFHGETTFINRPSSTVIQDFQNKYATSQGTEAGEVITQLTGLIELVMNSKELGDEDREETVAAVHSVAEQLDQGSANKLTVRGTLEAIRDVVTKAADIAGPSVAIVSTVLKLLGLA